MRLGSPPTLKAQYINLFGEAPPVLAGLHDQGGGLDLFDELLGAVRKQGGAVGGANEVELALVGRVLQNGKRVSEGVVPNSP